MRIIHMSDLHLTSDKLPIWGVDTYKQFVKALNSIGSIPNIDCIVVSGDIADDGNLLTYQYADDMLNSLSIPVLWCPGNHDNIETFFGFAESSKSIIKNPITINGIQLIPLNTVAPDESYPNLKANDNFMSLQNDLNILEADIANSRKYYNGTVKIYNTKIQLFPTNIVAGMFHFTRFAFFEVSNEAERENVKVEF